MIARVHPRTLEAAGCGSAVARGLLSRADDAKVFVPVRALTDQDVRPGIVVVHPWVRDALGVGSNGSSTEGVSFHVLPTTLPEASTVTLRAAPTSGLRAAHDERWRRIVARKLRGQALAVGGLVSIPLFGRACPPLVVTSASPVGAAPAVLVGTGTRILIDKPDSDSSGLGAVPAVATADIAKLVRDEIGPLLNGAAARPAWVLLTGRRGLGKTVLLRQLGVWCRKLRLVSAVTTVYHDCSAEAAATGAPGLRIGARTVALERVPQRAFAEMQRLRGRKEALVIVCVDHIDEIVPTGGATAATAGEGSLVTRLERLRRELIASASSSRTGGGDGKTDVPGKEGGKEASFPVRVLVVVARAGGPAKARPNAQLLSLFDREIGLDFPGLDARKDIMAALATAASGTSSASAAPPDWVNTVARSTQGFSPRDLARLVNGALMRAKVRRVLAGGGADGPPQIVRKDITGALDGRGSASATHTPPSGPAGIPHFDVGPLRGPGWESAAGYSDTIASLKAVLSRWQDPARGEALGVPRPSGVLLVGPSGCGKTLLARALATESKANVIQVSSSLIFSAYFGMSAAALRAVYDKAERHAPCVVFLDEVDALGARRRFEADGHSGVDIKVQERVLSTLLNLLDGIDSRRRGAVLTVAATNRPGDLDSALTRPGRFGDVVRVPLPSEGDRLAILQLHTQKLALDGDCSLSEIAKLSDAYTGADLAALCGDAALLAFRRAAEGKGRPEAAVNVRVRRNDFLAATR